MTQHLTWPQIQSYTPTLHALQVYILLLLLLLLPWLPVLSHIEPPALKLKAAMDGLMAKATVHCAWPLNNNDLSSTSTLANIVHPSIV